MLIDFKLSVLKTMQYYLLELFALYIKTLEHSKCKTI